MNLLQMLLSSSNQNGMTGMDPIMMSSMFNHQNMGQSGMSGAMGGQGSFSPMGAPGGVQVDQGMLSHLLGSGQSRPSGDQMGMMQDNPNTDIQNMFGMGQGM